MTILSMQKIMPILSHEERDRRWNNMRQEMEKRKLDALVVYGNSGRYRHLNARLRYLCNFHTEGYLILPLKDDPTLFSFIGGFPPII